MPHPQVINDITSVQGKLLTPTTVVAGKVMFSQACVKNSVHWGVCIPHMPPPLPGHACLQAHVPPGMHTHPSAHTSPGHEPPMHIYTTHPPRHACPPSPPRRYYEMRSMSGRYASYWNALLFVIRLCPCTKQQTNVCAQRSTRSTW